MQNATAAINCLSCALPADLKMIFGHCSELSPLGNSRVQPVGVNRGVYFTGCTAFAMFAITLFRSQIKESNLKQMQHSHSATFKDIVLYELNRLSPILPAATNCV